jgi:hypothetical protein
LGIYHQDPGQNESAYTTPNKTVQILPPKAQAPLHGGFIPGRRSEQYARLFEEFVRHARFTNKFIGAAAGAIAAAVAIAVLAALWPFHHVSKIETANKLPQAVGTPVPSQETTASLGDSAKVPFPLPDSFGIYALSDNKLVELEQLSIPVPDVRIALSAEINKPSSIIIPDGKPAFILFRRDLQNNVPQKIVLRIIARMAKETTIVDGKAKTINLEGTWRIRNISRDLKISPIPGQREMVMAHIGDEGALDPGRYVLVINRTGYDFTVAGPVQSPVFCLEKFEAANGSVFNQCRTL